MKTKLPLTIRAKVYEMERVANVTHHVESYWVGRGFPLRSESKRPRRYLRIRTREGICKYFLWTEPDKGKEVICVARFRRRVQISLEQVMKHYKIEK